MTCPAPTFVDRGKNLPPSQRRPQMMTHPDRPRRPEPVAPAASNPLERLAQLLLSNDRLIADLTASRSRIVSALAYLDQPDCNLRFGSAHLERCRARHSGILAELRANRVEALHLLGSPSQPND